MSLAAIVGVVPHADRNTEASHRILRKCLFNILCKLTEAAIQVGVLIEMDGERLCVIDILEIAGPIGMREVGRYVDIGMAGNVNSTVAPYAASIVPVGHRPTPRPETREYQRIAPRL